MSFFFPGYEGWAESTSAASSDLVAKVSGLDWGDGVRVKTQTLSFYPDAEFLVYRDPSWVPANLFVYALKQGSHLCWLNGTSPPIHQFNAAGNLKLSEENVLDYLQFFCFFVRGEEGPFYVVDSLNAPYLPDIIRDGADAGNLSTLGARFQERYQSPRQFGKAEDGKWRFSATIYYSNAVFVGDFMVRPDGMIELAEDTPVLADIPVKISAPIVPVQAVSASS